MFAITRFPYVEVQSFPYILLLLGRVMCFVVLKTSLYGGSLNLACFIVLEVYLSLATLCLHTCDF